MADTTTQAAAAPSLNAKCVSEILGTMVGIYLGCSVVANALLPGAKGQSMGFGWIGLGYGLAFFLPGVFFGHVSADLNPAVSLSKVVLGEYTAGTFFALAASEMVGAFLGGVLVWLHWLPHFKTVPEPPAINPADNLLRKRDALPKNAIEISSYNPASNARQQQVTRGASSGLPGGSSMRRRRPTDGPQDNIQRAGTVVGNTSMTRSQQLASAGSDADRLLRIPVQKVQEATNKVRHGFTDTAREWLSDFMYYAVHHDRFRKPPRATSARLPDPKISTVTPVRYQSLEHGRDGDAAGQSPRHGNGLATVHEDEEAGLGDGMPQLNPPPVAGSDAQHFAAEDGWNPEEERVSRSVLHRVFQQEMLEQQVKLVAPGLFYTSAALSAAAQEPGESAAPDAGQQDQDAAAPPQVEVEMTTMQSGGEGEGRPASPFSTYSSKPFGFAAAEQQPAPAGPLSALAAAGGPVNGSGRLTFKPEDTAASRMLGEGDGGGMSREADAAAAAAAAVASTALEEERRRIMALYDAALVADQNAKLSVFTTRPAIYAPPFNWLSEFMATVMLVTGINLFVAQMSQQGLPGEALQPFYVGMFIACQVLGLGGTTGFSVNPARDLGPRIAHAVLPIPNKGSSEWYYGWVPVTASLAGGVAGAGLWLAIKSVIWP